jgi:signal transduction histidine kinase/CheY-like chemotaxis protein
MSKHTWKMSLCGATLTGLLLALWVMLRQLSASALFSSWDLILIAALLGGTVTFAAHTLAGRRYRQALQRLGLHLGRFREGPSSQGLATELGKPGEELADLLAPVEALCSAYRHVLAARVAKSEALDSLRVLVGQMDTDSQKLAVRTSGSSRNMVARLTPNLFWMTATPALQALVNSRMTELNGRPFLEVVHPADLPGVERHFQEALDTGEAHNVGFRIVPRVLPASGAGPEYHVTMDVLTRYTDDGKALHLRCFFVDTTARVRAEQEARRRTEELSHANERLRGINQDLERLKESYRDLYHNAPVMYFSLDARGHFVTLNETLQRTLGYAREDLWKQPYTRLLPPESLRAWEAGGDAVPATVPNPAANGMAPCSTSSSHAMTREGEVETQWLKKDGTVIDVWIRTIPIRDGNGRFIRSRSAAQDVTLRNRLGNELRARRDELERANADLRQINRELEEFTSVVSHDLKEPLRTLQAFSNFLAEDFSGQLGPDGFQYINHLVQASKRLGKLIDDLLALSRAGRITPDLESFNLIEIVAIVRRDLADMVQRKEADLLVEGSLPAVVGDPQRITQLLSNLVGNGLKYNTSPKPQVAIGQVPDGNADLGTPAGGAGYATLYVRDNGIGIDARFHQQIFGIFRRLHQAEEYEGTGAGLAICKKIVEAHNGRIWLESTPGQGSTFYFTLPRAPAELGETSSPQPGRLPPEQPSRSTPAKTTMLAHDLQVHEEPAGLEPADGGGPRRILLVEDMPEIGLIAQKLGQRGRHEVTWLKTGEEAWDHLQSACPDLLLLDIHLPGMNGVELCRRLRTLPHLEDMPIALFTQGSEDEAWCREIGANFILSKDLLCRPDDWLNRLEELLQSTAATCRSGSSHPGTKLSP